MVVQLSYLLLSVSCSCSASGCVWRIPLVVGTEVQVLARVQDQTVQLWNPHRGLHIKTYRGHGYEVRDVAVLRDNSQFATGGGDREIFLWDVASGRTIRRFRGHEKMVNAVCAGWGSVVHSLGWMCRDPPGSVNRQN